MRATHSKQFAKPKLVPNVADRPLPEPLAVRVPQAANLLSVSERQVWSWIASGRLQAHRVSGRITLVSVASIKALLAGSAGDAA